MWPRLRLLAVALALASHHAAFAVSSDPAVALKSARSLKCHFERGFATHWEGNQSKTAPGTFNVDVVFDNIDYRRGTARVIGNLGAANATISSSPVGLSIIEVEPGVTDLTTVFAAYNKSGDFLAVDTRHANVAQFPMAEQFFGACKLWQ